MAARSPSILILVADDNEDCRESLIAVLELSGYKVISACDGREALLAAQKFRPAAIFTDIGMPEMDGFELAAAIRADEALRGTVVVAVSGWGNAHDPDREAAAAFDLHLVKPAEISEILEAATQATMRRGDGHQ